MDRSNTQVRGGGYARCRTTMGRKPRGLGTRPFRIGFLVRQVGDMQYGGGDGEVAPSRGHGNSL